MTKVDQGKPPRCDWFAAHPTHIKTSDTPAVELRDSEKKWVAPLSLLSARVLDETEACYVIADAALNYVPLAPHLKYISKPHWAWPPPDEWIARRPASITAHDMPAQNCAAEDKRELPTGTRLHARIMEETPDSWLITKAELRGKPVPPRLRYIAKTAWRLRPPPKAYTEQAPLGYYYNNGGLNNQRVALLGLFLRAKEWQRAIVLPEMSIKNIANNSENPAVLMDFFNLDAVLALATRHGIDIVRDDPAEWPTGGWDYFNRGAGEFSLRAQYPERYDLNSDLVIDFMRNVRPVPRIAALLAQLKKRIFGEEGIELAAQFRIETDWVKHSEHLHARVKEPEDFLIPYYAIAAKIAVTRPEQKKILVICDEAAVAISKQEMRAICLKQNGIELFFKSYFLSNEEIEELDFLTRAIIDFELAAGAKYFVGLTRSSFSNLVSFQKFALSGERVKTDYIYNNDKKELGLRTDNGGWDSPWRAVL